MFDIRDNLSLFINEYGYKKSVIARESNLTPSQFSNILNKKRNLHVSELFDICNMLKISPDELKDFKNDLKKEGETFGKTTKDRA